MEKIKKIDIHAHAAAVPDMYPPLFSGERLVSAEELLEIYEKLGIEKGMLLPISSPEAQFTGLSNESQKYIADKYPDNFLWYCNVDPRAGNNTPEADLSSILAFYKEKGAKGVGEITANIYADDPKMDNLFSACEELSMPALFHMARKVGGYYGIADEVGMPRLEKMIKKHPNLTFIGHSQVFWAEISADCSDETRGGYPTGKVTEGRIVKLMREYPNLYCDLSAGSGANAMMRDEEFAAKFFEEFSDRIMYGCDICLGVRIQRFFDFSDMLERMRKEGILSEENYRKIVRENAIKVFNL